VRVQPIFLFSLTLLISASAQAKRKFVEIDRQFSIHYKSKNWDADAKNIDSAFLIFRDAVTGRMAQISLEETAPNSGEFVGRFSVVWSDTTKVSPEVYIPPQNMRDQTKKIFDMVANKKLPRKPIIVKKAENGEKTIEVFETREEAESAWADYQKELKARDTKLMKPIPTREDSEAAAQAAHQKQLEDLAKEAQNREASRQQLGTSEQAASTSRLQEFNKLNPDQRAARVAKAKLAYEDGLKDYTAGDFVSAEKKFREAIVTDPSESNYYYRYGISQFRNDKMNEAIASLRLSPEEPSTALERKYFLGLIHYRLQELDDAVKYFDEVGNSKDPVLAPSSLFYKGVVQYSKEDYEEAKKSFEQVIDQSQDPKIDEQAEAYIDRVAAAIAYKKMQSLKWNVTGTVGLMYDSNVLLAPDNQVNQGTALNKGDVRLLTMGTLEYRPIFTQTNEFSVKGTANLTNSSNANLSTADPWIYTFEAPYTYKGMLWGKGYKTSLRPGYELLYMSLTADAAKKNLMYSPYLGWDNTFVMNPKWFSGYTLEVRHDGSSIPYTTPDDNFTAMMYALRSTQTFMLNPEKREALMITSGLIRNSADGKNKSYDRFEVGTTYAKPFGTYAWNASLNYYYLTYPSATPGRVDNNVMFSTGVSKPIKEWFTWGGFASYTTNASSQSAYEYEKFVVMTTATFNTLF
jgi:TolA-binding protein